MTELKLLEGPKEGKGIAPCEACGTPIDYANDIKCSHCGALTTMGKCMEEIAKDEFELD